MLFQCLESNQLLWFKKKAYFLIAYSWTTVTPKVMRTLKSNLKCTNVIALNQTVEFYYFRKKALLQTQYFIIF